MDDSDRTKDELIAELVAARTRIAELSAAAGAPGVTGSGGGAAAAGQARDDQAFAMKALLDAIAKAQVEFLFEADRKVVFDRLLAALLESTASEYGFIGEVLRTTEGEPYLRTYAITNIAWNEETKRFYDQYAPTGLEFFNTKTLFGVTLLTEEVVIANDPSSDPRGAGTPTGHPPLRAFLGLPLHCAGQMIGMAGIANRPGGYTGELVEFLQPILSTCANLIEAHRRDKARQELDARATASAAELEQKNQLLEREIEERRRAEEMFRRQSDAVLAMSTPIIQVWDGVIALPIIGFIDSARAARIMESLLQEIVRREARHAILDLTGVDTVDTATASYLLNIVRGAGLLGSSCAISGLSPTVAQIMVGLGIGTEGLASFGTLQDALRHAIEREMRQSSARRR